MAHIDTYVPPASWTDLDMDWENPTAQKACYVDAIRCAIHERYRLFSSSGLGGLSFTPDMILNCGSSALRGGSYSLAGLHEFLLGRDSIVRGFLNPSEIIKTRDISYEGNTITIGDGRAESAEWTKHKDRVSNYLNTVAICENLGVDSLVSPQPYSRDNSEWLKQAYNILNLCRYIAVYPSDETIDSNDISTYTYRYFRRSDEPDYENEDTTATSEQMTSFSVSKSSTHRISSETGYYYYSGHAGKRTTKFSYYLPGTYRINGYVWSSGAGSDFDNFYPYFAPNIGYFYTPVTTSFGSGLRVFEFDFGDTEILPKRPTPSGEERIYNISHSLDYFIIEHDFKFKGEGD